MNLIFVRPNIFHKPDSPKPQEMFSYMRFIKEENGGQVFFVQTKYWDQAFDKLEAYYDIFAYDVIAMEQ